MTPGPAGPLPRRSDVARQIVLAAIAFVATLVLVAGLLAVLGRSSPSAVGPSGSTKTSASASASGSARGSVSASAAGSGSAGPSGSTGASDSPGASGSGPTPSAATGDPVLVGAGDIGDCDSPGDEQTAAQILQIPGTVFTAGDNAYPDGSLTTFQECYSPTWGQFLDRTRPAPGNHDWETPKAAGYTAYFGTRATPDGATWYAYDLGAWHIVVLDSDCAKVSGCGPESAQGRWLAKDLAASKASCTLAIFHHPRWSSGEHGDDPTVDPFWRALYTAGVDVIVNGHDHDYERFAPQDPAGHADGAQGIRQFVVGTGGTALRDFTHLAPNSEFKAAVDHGVLRLVLHAGSYSWTFLPSKGGFSDAGSTSCH